MVDSTTHRCSSCDFRFLDGIYVEGEHVDSKSFCSFDCLSLWVVEELSEDSDKKLYVNSKEAAMNVLREWIE